MSINSTDGSALTCQQPGDRQSLSPFESHTTTMVVWWSLLFICTGVLVVCWTLWI